jgi:DNA-binding Lrp family transcriptional regulator
MLRIMSDAATASPSIREDASERFKLSEDAVRRGMRRLQVRGVDALGERLGYKRLAFYRLRTGKSDIKLAQALAIAEQLGLPVTRAFERVDN